MTLRMDLKKWPKERLEDMADAGNQIRECYRLLKKADRNVVGQCLEHQGTFYEFDHYPQGDVYDGETHSQYYYHSHRPEAGEHGHFHTFLRVKGMPRGIRPVPYDGEAERPEGDDALCHFVAIAMDIPGYPINLFTTNRWVTDESFYTAEDTIAMLDRFKMDHVWPCLAVNQWITAMLRLFRPQIEELLIERDRVMARWQKKHPDRDVYEDRELDITSQCPVDVEKQIRAVERALRAVA